MRGEEQRRGDLGPSSLPYWRFLLADVRRKRISKEFGVPQVNGLYGGQSCILAQLVGQSEWKKSQKEVLQQHSFRSFKPTKKCYLDDISIRTTRIRILNAYKALLACVKLFENFHGPNNNRPHTQPPRRPENALATPLPPVWNGRAVAESWLLCPRSYPDNRQVYRLAPGPQRDSL
ncbi:hypothetical protein TNCV_4088041 [Trichonephila clavipes]|nr:hypothetical protein TNCV_4088041 [Trichonephila clavipes]